MRCWIWISATLVAFPTYAQLKSVTDPGALRPNYPPAKPPAREASTQEENIQTTQSVPKGNADDAAAFQTSPPVPPSTLENSELHLVCGGGGTANKPTVTTVTGSSSMSGSVGIAPITLHGNSSGTIWGQRQQDFADQVDVRLFSDDDRIRLPRTMLPLFRGGKEGWFKLKDVKADGHRITASAGVNVLNNPKVHIDRVTGTISINGKAGTYTGSCERIDAREPAKF